MTQHPLRCFALASLLLALAVPCARAGDEPPFTCFTEAWDGTFELVSTRYDRKTNRLVWVLRTKKATSIKRYEAFLADGDGVELARIKIRFDPNRASFPAGKRIQAIISLGNVPSADLSRLTVRELR